MPTKPLGKISFNQPSVSNLGVDYVAQALNGTHHSGDGPFTRQCQQLLEDSLKVQKVLLTTSCTHALEMAALLLDLHPGDEVIFPSFTFVSTANAFVIHGAKPVFCDICPHTLNLDATALHELITNRTKAIVPVHYAGVACDMDEILKVAHGIKIIEDNAHGLFGQYKGRYLGTFGDLATQSFHETKNFSCGEGGALLINNSKLIERAEIIREKGTNRSKFFRGQVDKYTWIDVGSSYLPSDILAAMLLAQLEERQDIQGRRRKIWLHYMTELEQWAALNDVRTQFVPHCCKQTYHMFYLLMPSLQARSRFIGHLKQQEIQCVFHYLPLHLSVMGQRHGGKTGDCPVTEDVSDRLVRLPFYPGLTNDDQDRVIKATLSFRA